MEELSDTNIIISTVISGVLGSSLFAEEVEEYWGLLDSNSEDLWLSSVVDSSSWVITLSTVVAMLHDWAKVKEKCSVMLPKRDNTMVGVSRQQVNPGGFQVVVMGEVPSKEVDMVECLA